jgi:hypothetical protein
MERTSFYEADSRLASEWSPFCKVYYVFVRDRRQQLSRGSWIQSHIYTLFT